MSCSFLLCTQTFNRDCRFLTVSDLHSALELCWTAHLSETVVVTELERSSGCRSLITFYTIDCDYERDDEFFQVFIVNLHLVAVSPLKPLLDDSARHFSVLQYIEIHFPPRTEHFDAGRVYRIAGL